MNFEVDQDTLFFGVGEEFRHFLEWNDMGGDVFPSYTSTFGNSFAIGGEKEVSFFICHTG